MFYATSPPPPASTGYCVLGRLSGCIDEFVTYNKERLKLDSWTGIVTGSLGWGWPSWSANDHKHMPEFLQGTPSPSHTCGSSNSDTLVSKLLMCVPREGLGVTDFLKWPAFPSIVPDSPSPCKHWLNIHRTALNRIWCLPLLERSKQAHPVACHPSCLKLFYPTIKYVTNGQKESRRSFICLQGIYSEPSSVQGQ